MNGTKAEVMPRFGNSTGFATTFGSFVITTLFRAVKLPLPPALPPSATFTTAVKPIAPYAICLQRASRPTHVGIRGVIENQTVRVALLLILFRPEKDAADIGIVIPVKQCPNVIR